MSKAAVATMIAVFVLLSVSRFASSQDANSSKQLQSENKNDSTVVTDRYEKILRASPQFGTAFDKFYEGTEREGKLDAFCLHLEQQAVKTQDSKLFHFLGLLQQRRGLVDEAIANFASAQEISPEQVVVKLHLSSAFTQRRQYESALAALRKASQSKLSQANAIELTKQIMQLQRHVDRDSAVEVLDSVAKQFPTSQAVLEKVTESVAAFNPERAGPLYEKLISMARDPQRKIELQVERAKILERVGQSERALAEFERIVAQVKPGSWLYSNLSEQIDRLTEQLSGSEGLIQRHERALAKQPNDIEAHLRLANLLNAADRVDEAKSLLTKAHQLSPTQTAPLLATVEILEQRQDFHEAVVAMNQLLEIAPDNADFIRRGGKLLLKDNSKSIDERRDQVVAVWKKMLVGHERDAVRFAQVAELFIESEIPTQAVSCLEEAIRFAENGTEYRESLATYLHRLGRSDESRKVIADGIEAAAESRLDLARLSDTANRLGFREEAINAMQLACNNHPEFSDRMKFAKLLKDANRLEQALAQLQLAANQAEKSDDLNRLWDAQIDTLRNNNELSLQIEQLENQLQSDKQTSAGSWQQLALLYSALAKSKQAADAARRATDLEPNDLRSWLLAARMEHDAKLAFREIESLRKLCGIDSQNKVVYLQRLATIQFQQNQVDDSLSSFDAILETKGASLENFKSAWTFCLQAKMPERALAYMRRATGVFPKDRTAWIAIARLLNDPSNADSRPQAMEALWHALEYSKESEQQREAFDMLSTYFKDAKGFEDLTDRLQSFGVEKDRVQDADKWTAWALQSSDQPEAPEWFFDRLARQSQVDPLLLEACVELAVKYNDTRRALDFQKRLNGEAQNANNQLRLGEFLALEGDLRGAKAAWSAVMNEPKNRESLIAFAKDLVARKRLGLVAELVTLANQESVIDWEIIATGIFASIEQGELDQAARLATQLIELELEHATPARVSPARDALSDQALSATANDRLAWLEHAGPWQSKLNEVNLTRSGYRTNQANLRSAQAAAVRQLAAQRGAALRTTTNQFPTMQCYGDARALAILAKYGKVNLKRTTAEAEWLQYVDTAIATKSVDRLWDCVLVLEPQRSQAIVVNSLGEIETRSNAGLARYPQVLDSLVELGDTTAIELAINDVVTRRHLQHQMAGRLNQIAPAMASQELSRLQALIERCHTRGIATSLLSELTLAFELLQAAPHDDASRSSGVRVMQDALAKSNDLSELARCAIQFQTLENQTQLVTERTLLRGFEVQLRSTSNSTEFQLAIRSYVGSKDSVDGSLEAFLRSLVRAQADYVASLSPKELSVDSRANTLRKSYRNSASDSVIVTAPDHSSLCSTSLWLALTSAYAVSAPELMQFLQSEAAGTSSNAPDVRNPQAVCAVSWFCLSAIQSLQGQSKPALESLQKAAEQSVAPEIVALQRVRQLVAAGQLPESTSELNKITASNDSILRECELWKLELALRTNNETEALRSALVLENLPLSMLENTEVATVLNKIPQRQ